MKYVYLIQSLTVPSQRYIGITANLDERLRIHNAGGSHTRPNIALGNSCCLSASKMNSVRVSSNDISSPDQGMPLRKSVSGEPSCPPTARN